MRVCLRLICAVFIAFASINSYSESPVKKLSPELRSLLKQEMLAIQEGMKDIVPAFISGDLERVSIIAGSISRSFIMKKKITDEQKHELHKVLPVGFIEKDQKFHKYAAMLEHVSQEKHTELVSFYYSKMLESCLGCHSEYAEHKFPLLSDKTIEKGHHH